MKFNFRHDVLLSLFGISLFMMSAAPAQAEGLTPGSVFT